MNNELDACIVNDKWDAVEPLSTVWIEVTGTQEENVVVEAVKACVESHDWYLSTVDQLYGSCDGFEVTMVCECELTRESPHAEIDTDAL